MEDSTLAEYIQRASSGDLRAISTLYGVIRSYLNSRIKFLPSSLDFDDLVQSATTAIFYTSTTDIRDNNCFLSYVYITARNLIKDHIRALRRRKCISLENSRISYALPASYDFGERNPEREEMLAIFLNALTAHERKLFFLLFVRGDSPDEIARALNISAHCFRVRKFRLRKKLQKTYRAYSLCD